MVEVRGKCGRSQGEVWDKSKGSVVEVSGKCGRSQREVW